MLFVVLGHSLPFDPPKNQKMKNFKKKKKMPGGIITLRLCTTNDNHDVWFLIYQARQTEFFCHFELFLALLPPTIQKINILKK